MKDKYCSKCGSLSSWTCIDPENYPFEQYQCDSCGETIRIDEESSSDRDIYPGAMIKDESQKSSWGKKKKFSCHVSRVKQKRGWKVEDEEYKECSYAEDLKVKIYMPVNIWALCMQITKEMGNYEWIGYFKGKADDDKNYIVENLIVPKQEVSYASAKPKDEVVQVVGVIHSHGDNGFGGFSGTDDDYINKNNGFSVLISGNGKYHCVSLVKLPCGGIFEKKCKIVFTFDQKEFDLKGILKNIEVNKTYVYNGLQGKVRMNEYGNYY